MSDLDPIKPDETEPKKYPFWPDSLNASFETGRPQQAGKFARLRRALSAVGKLAVQNIIWGMIFIIFFILLIPSIRGISVWGSDQNYLAVQEVIKLITLTISVFLAIRILENIEIADLGLRLGRRTFHDFSAGLLISFSFLAMEFLFYWGSGWITIQSFAWQSMSILNVIWNLTATFIIFLFTGWSEELLSRGYHLRILSKGSNKFIGVLLSSGFFAYLHHDNDGITLANLIFIFLFGILMSYAFFRTGQLWLAIGLHTGWDFFGGVVFWGTPIYGLKIFNLLNLKYNGAIGYFATEVLGLIIMAVFIHFYWLHQKPEPLVDW